ncbi:MAG TPA: hypothetical protein PKO07_26905 [Pseudomonadota bacterium]|nr:hypothetical protein [Pseudomonadota bacterium]
MRPLVLALALLFTTSVANADEQIRQPPTLRDAAKAHFRDGQAFFQSEQFGPAIVEFRAAWELSGERDLLHNLSWACEKAGRVIEAKDYASRYLAQSRGTEDEAMAERRVKFLSSRYPDAEAAPATTAPEAKPSAAPEANPPTTAQAATVATDSPKPSVKRRPLAIGLLVGGGAALVVSAGLAGGAIGAWAEAANPDTYFDRWQSLNSRGQALSIVSGVFGAVGVGLIVPGIVLVKRP